jgi:para-nitrobenzyl esterase
MRSASSTSPELAGDPGNVTIFGQSGGGGKVSTIMAMPSAAGLFHRAIVQSGSYARNAHLEAMKPEQATGNARTLLTTLEINPSDIATKLVNMPTDSLVAGITKAARAATPSSFAWRPVVDGKILPSGPWWPDGPSVSANVPLIIGTTETEMTGLIGVFDQTAFSLDEDGLRKRLSALMSPEDAGTVISTFKGTRPNATPSDLFFAITTANSFRRGAWQQADRKAAQNAEPVYVYELDWHTPADSGKWQSPHSLEIALVFDNVAVSEAMVGTGPEAQKVSDQMSAAWLAFARTGNPNTAAIPNWPAYTVKNRETMVFNVKSEVINDFRSDERKVLAELKSKGPYD